jgi:hypothetical protein
MEQIIAAFIDIPKTSYDNIVLAYHFDEKMHQLASN